LPAAPFLFVLTLESVSQTKRHDSRFWSACSERSQALCFAKVATAEVGCNAIEVGVIREILRLRAEVQCLSLRDLEGFSKALVPLDGSRSFESVSSQVSKTLIRCS
jgi:hypothetical protein